MGFNYFCHNEFHISTAMCEKWLSPPVLPFLYYILKSEQMMFSPDFVPVRASYQMSNIWEQYMN